MVTSYNFFGLFLFKLRNLPDSDNALEEILILFSRQ